MTAGIDTDSSADSDLTATHGSRQGMALAGGIIGFGLCFAGMFLPWANFDYGSTGQFTGGVRGVSVAASAALSLGALLYGLRTRTPWAFWLSAAGGLLATVLTLDFWFRELLGLTRTYKGFDLDIGPTLPGMALGGLLLTVAAYEASRRSTRQ